MENYRILNNFLPIAAFCLTLVGMTASGTWFLISLAQTSENLRYVDLVESLERSLEIQKKILDANKLTATRLSEKPFSWFDSIHIQANGMQINITENNAGNIRRARLS